MRTASRHLTWQRVLDRWKLFEADIGVEVTLESVPWPASAQQLLHDLAALIRADRACGSSYGSSSASPAGCYTARDSSRSCCAQDGSLFPSHSAAVPPEAEEAAKKAAFRRAVLRWHPDKFAGRLGGRVPAHQQTAVMARVQALAQDLNAIASGSCTPHTPSTAV